MARKLSAREEHLNDLVDRFSKSCSLDSWNSFVEALDVPSELVPALAANRWELIKLATPRALQAAEVKVLYELIGKLMQTNQALRTHAHQLAQLADLWEASFKQLRTTGYKIQQFAHFKKVGDLVEEEEEETVA